MSGPKISPARRRRTPRPERALEEGSHARAAAMAWIAWRIHQNGNMAVKAVKTFLDMPADPA
jgi:hypothetical protein